MSKHEEKIQENKGCRNLAIYEVSIKSYDNEEKEQVAIPINELIDPII